MKQRVAIARAFATDADLILMDEPFVSLDQPTRERMQREVLDIWRHRKRTVIFVTHNLEEAVFLGRPHSHPFRQARAHRCRAARRLARTRATRCRLIHESRAQCVRWLHARSKHAGTATQA